MSEYSVRRAASILRQFGPLVQGGEWTPHIPVTSQDNLVYTSQFRAANQTIWLLVNRCCWDRIVVEMLNIARDVRSGGGVPPLVASLSLPCEPGQYGYWVDLYHGLELAEAACDHQEAVTTNTAVWVEPGGIGAVLFTQDIDLELQQVKNMFNLEAYLATL